MDLADQVAGHQLAKAGFRLASLLNEIWAQPVGPNDVTHAENSARGQTLSPKTDAGQIVGNRRSKIYAWPGCRTYDRMAVENRVEFSSRGAAEQAGYRAAGVELSVSEHCPEYAPYELQRKEKQIVR